MPISAGTRFGTYEITGSLGSGGMGEVYRARDTRLHRDVAVKILPDAFEADPDRRLRFEREAQVLASLNHPNIAQIHGVEESSGRPALVMELVEGRTLDQLDRALPVDEVVAIVRQMADALETAHEHGIIHRDLKPSNVKVRPDGAVKVLDFGLAKALDGASSSDVDAMNSPTLTVRGTQMGVIVGTAAYMAPEQARGKPVDRRADVWALGAVLFELLSGSRAFDGETVSDTLAAVLTRDPDWTKIKSGTPVSLVQLTRRCLRKDPRRRPQSAGDVRVALDDIASGEAEAVEVVPPAPPRNQRRTYAVLAAGLCALVAIGYLLISSIRPSADRPARTIPMLLAEDVPLALQEAPAFAMSPDGTTLAFVGGDGSSRQLYVRRLDEPTATAIAGTVGASSPFFSPDGRWIAFVAAESLKKVRTTGGGLPERLTSATDRGGVWLNDDTIVYALNRASPLFRIPAAGGEASPLTSAKPGATHRFPTALPERRALLFTARNAGESVPYIAAFDLQTGNQTTLIENAYHAVYGPPGRVLFMREGALYRAALDDERLTIAGPETRVLESLRGTADAMAGQYAASGPVLVYQAGKPGGALDRGIVVWRSVTGQEQPLIPEVDTYRDLQFSPNGRRLAYSVLPPGRPTDLWVFDRSRGLKTRLTYDEKVGEWWPVWSPDGRSLAYSATESGIKLMAGDGSGEKPTLTTNTQQWQVPGSFSPDGRLLAYHELHRETAGDIWVAALGTNDPPKAFLRTPFYEGLPMFSPNGRWIAYTSNESGAYEIYVRPYPGPGPKHQISGDQTFDVHYWSADGTKLFYRSGDGRRMMSVPVQTDGTEFEFGKPSVLFELDPALYPDLQFWGSFAAAPDGSGFAIVKRTERETAVRTYLMLTLDW
jgi:serine/threonine-protein kinase